MSKYDFTIYNRKKISDSGKAFRDQKTYIRITPMDSLIMRMEEQFSGGVFTVNQDWRSQIFLIPNVISMNAKLLAVCYDIYSKTSYSFLIKKDKKVFEEIVLEYAKYFDALDKYELFKTSELKRRAEELGIKETEREKIIPELRVHNKRYYRFRQDLIIYMIAVKKAIVDYIEGKKEGVSFFSSFSESENYSATSNSTLHSLYEEDSDSESEMVE